MLVSKIKNNSYRYCCNQKPSINALLNKAAKNDSFEIKSNNSEVIHNIDPIKKAYINNSHYLSMYQKESEKDIYKNVFTNERFNVLDNSNIEELKSIEILCQEIEEINNQTENNYNLPKAVKCMVDLHYFNPDAYQYIKDNPYLLEKYIKKKLSKSYFCLQNMTPAGLKEIEKGYIDSLIRDYISNSDSFIKNPEKVQKLNKCLAENKTEGIMIVQRAERETGMFNEIPIEDKTLTTKIKLTNFIHQLETRKATFSGFEKSYTSANLKGKLTIYEYIKNKENLSLADAMLMMPYLDKNMQSKILELIKGAKVSDDRFKSTTFSNEFPYEWLSSSSNPNPQAKIINTITLPKGIEGRYIEELDNITIGNRQCEFLINNINKEITVTDVAYDAEKNIFHIKSNLKVIE